MRTHDHNTRISAYIAEKFPLAKKRKLRDEDSLLESGVIDSLGILDLVHYLEAEFEIQVSDDELVPENFESVSSITAFVVSKSVANERSQA